MFTDRNVRRGLAAGIAAAVAVLVPGAGQASAQTEKIIKVVLPIPTVNVPSSNDWHRTGTVMRNLYPQVELKKGLQTDSSDPVTVTLTIASSDVVFLYDYNGAKVQTLTLEVTIPEGKASTTFDIAVATGGTWHAGESPTVTGVPAAGSGYTDVVQIGANVQAAQILSQMDIDADGLPDGAPDSDGDGLPDNWEQGGYRSWLDTEEESAGADRLVKFSAPTAIGPGTPPVFVLNRQAVTTAATSYDTDGDGLTDFVEVFGLKFIDRNGNGVLDTDEWADVNNDGLPSIGEYPIQKEPDLDRGLEHNFAGFMFADPSNADTDGDKLLDGEDPEPLINPRTFGVDRGSFSRIGANDIKADLDNDGLGNGADFGNDRSSLVDQPEDLESLIRIFRKNLYRRDIDGKTVIPETIIEDLVGADWDGNGLYRVTDVRNFLPYVLDDASPNSPEVWLGSRDYLYDKLFKVGEHNLFAAANLNAAVVPDGTVSYGVKRKIGLGIQDLLLQTEASKPFFPDIRVWTILYAWRVPGFDIDGNGYVGSNQTNDDVHEVHKGGRLDGQIDSPLDFSNCGIGAGQALALTLLGLSAMKVTVAPRMRRRQG